MPQARVPCPIGRTTLLPKTLAHEALQPQTGNMATHAGADIDATAAVTTRIRDQRTHVVLITRMIPVNSIETRLLQAWTNPEEPR